MFTGIVQAVGSVLTLTRRGGGARLAVKGALPGGRLVLGESIAVDGACITAARIRPGGFEADLSGETLACTTAGGWTRGRRVNLERALAAADRLGGHIVQGHVDGVGTVVSIRPGPGQTVVRVRVDAPLLPLIAAKGSIALDGVSLTVASLVPRGFEAVLIPHTIAATNLADRRAGDRVNVEVDLLARYLEQLLKERGWPGRRSRR